jgi:hypothetical protein
MIKTVQSVYNQSMYDLSAQVYNGLNNIVKLCTENSISDVNYVNTTPLPYKYDTAYKENQQNTINTYETFKYATGYLQARSGGEYDLDDYSPDDYT